MISPPLALRVLTLACLLAACGSAENRSAVPRPDGTGDTIEETGGTGGGNRTGGAGGVPATGGAGGAAGAIEATPDARAPEERMDASTPSPDVGGADATATGACGPSAAAPGTVLQLRASGGDPYAYFASKNLMPIDGPSSGYITDTGCSFKFVLHQNGAEETVSSGAQRQRNELTVNPGNPAMYKGTQGNTMSYTWRFRLDVMNADPTWCDIFQLKPHGALGVAPYLALQANKWQLQIEHFRAGDVRMVPLASIMGVWINVRFQVKLTDPGAMSISLTKDDGSMVMSYESDSIDMWEASTDFVRPKWGLYRNKRDGAGEAAIEYDDMTIIRGPLGPPPTRPACACAK